MQNLAYLGADGQVHVPSRVANSNNILGAPLLGAQMNNQAMMSPNFSLQNLAWLGEDNQVHHVNQPANGPMMLGSSAPQF